MPVEPVKQLPIQLSLDPDVRALQIAMIELIKKFNQLLEEVQNAT